ncbi:hypothetical protein ACHAW5_001167 [Stephanodiscus triporus]|uniref:C2H2-type domain-containing protein n=1 Tax=Stephanodiscus triporus TaxID=2934178 RepID=A0ABD3MRU0_9STRA
MKRMCIMPAILACTSCGAFDPTTFFRRHGTAHVAETMITSVERAGGRDRRMTTAAATSATTLSTTKADFVDSLDRPYDLNGEGAVRTSLLDDVIRGNDGLADPGSSESFASVAPGTWRVVYAPHMTAITSSSSSRLNTY